MRVRCLLTSQSASTLFGTNVFAGFGFLSFLINAGKVDDRVRISLLIVLMFQPWTGGLGGGLSKPVNRDGDVFLNRFSCAFCSALGDVLPMILLSGS